FIVSYCLATICTEFHSELWHLLGPQINTVLELDILSVAEQYQRQGIARKMLEKWQSTQVLKENNIQGIVVLATSYANQTLMESKRLK
ncbi:hypothetical protein GCK32_020560, partial [Trichostrongylus colubriformis]